MKTLTSIVIAAIVVLSHPSCRTSGGLPADVYVEADAARLFTTSVGEGEAIVVLHGGPGLDHSYLRPGMDRLADTYRVIYYDQRGTGRSTGEADSSRLTIGQFVDDLEHVRKGLFLERLNLLGHSWGGLLSLAYALEYPDRVASIVLASPIGASFEYLAAFDSLRRSRTTAEDSAGIAGIMASTSFAAGDTSAIADLLKTYFRSYFFVRDSVRSINLDVPPATAGNIFRIYGAFLPYLSTFDLRDSLAGLRSPVLVVYGEEDVIPTRFAEEIQRSIPGARSAHLSRCGHFPFVESPDPFFTAVSEFYHRFL